MTFRVKTRPPIASRLAHRYAPALSSAQLLRFWAKVDKGPDCWLWTASCRSGYGQFNAGTHIADAHRLSWVLANGPIEPGLLVCHTCDVPRCVYPEHLFLGTPADNMADMLSKNRGRRFDFAELPIERRVRGEAHPRAKLSAPQVTDARRRYAAGGITQRQLAEELGIGETTLHQIIHRQIWKHVR